MKDFFEDLGKRLGETAETMTNKAGEAIEIQRLRGQIRTLARGNAVDLMELGKTIYDRYKAGDEVGEKYRTVCEAIQNREESMEEYENKIARIKGFSECTNCGKMVGSDMIYCPYCGAKVIAGENKEPEKAETAENGSDEPGDEKNED